MNYVVMGAAAAGLLALCGAACAQTGSAVLDGQTAGFVVTPSPTGALSSQSILGSDKRDVIARASRATPLVVKGPDAVTATEQRRP